MTKENISVHWWISRIYWQKQQYLFSVRVFYICIVFVWLYIILFVVRNKSMGRVLNLSLDMLLVAYDVRSGYSKVLLQLLVGFISLPDFSRWQLESNL